MCTKVKNIQYAVKENISLKLIDAHGEQFQSVSSSLFL